MFTSRAEEELLSKSIEELYAIKNPSKRIECIQMKMRAPENSDEWSFFNKAEHFYELAELYKNSTHNGHKARNKANYWLKKAWKLRFIRTNKYA